MKIIRVIFLISIIIFLLCSCSLAGIRLNQLSNNDDFAIASNKMEIIIKAIETNDNALLKSVFSINALTEIDDIDANMNSLFDYINGNIDTWEQNSQIVDQTNSHGVKVRKARTWYTVNTNSNEYMFLLVDYTIDTENPDNVGLYMLEVLENKDRYEYDITGMNNPIAGIWLPSKNNTKNRYQLEMIYLHSHLKHNRSIFLQHLVPELVYGGSLKHELHNEIQKPKRK